MQRYSMSERFYWCTRQLASAGHPTLRSPTILGYLVSSLLQGYMSGWTNSLFDPSGGLSVVKDLAVTAIVII